MINYIDKFTFLGFKYLLKLSPSMVNKKMVNNSNKSPIIDIIVNSIKHFSLLNTFTSSIILTFILHCFINVITRYLTTIITEQPAFGKQHLQDKRHKYISLFQQATMLVYGICPLKSVLPTNH